MGGGGIRQVPKADQAQRAAFDPTWWLERKVLVWTEVIQTGRGAHSDPLVVNPAPLIDGSHGLDSGRG